MDDEQLKVFKNYVNSYLFTLLSGVSSGSIPLEVAFSFADRQHQLIKNHILWLDTLAAAGREAADAMGAFLGAIGELGDELDEYVRG